MKTFTRKISVKKVFVVSLFTFTFSLFTPQYCGAQYTDLVNFTGTNGSYSGYQPTGSLTRSPNGVLYGLTSAGGASGYGNIFSYNPATNTFNDLFDFNPFGSASPGYSPLGSLTLSPGGVLYGMTQECSTCYGTIFSYDTATHTFADLVDFTATSGAYPGAFPQGSLTLSPNGVLYGLTSAGGASGYGNIFSYNPVTNTFNDLFDFNPFGSASPGYSPLGSLTLSPGGVLYGMTQECSSCYGTIFSYDTATHVFANLVDFTGTNGTYPGAFPEGDLTLSPNGVLYGMTSQGGANYSGNIFSYNPATNTFTDLADFTGTNGKYPGEYPEGDLTLLPNGVLYGMTFQGGANYAGNIFSYDTAAHTFTDLVDFTGSNGTSPGLSPQGDLTLSKGGVLYGMTSVGGANNDGNIFSYASLTDTASQTGNIICNGGSNGVATATVSGGTSPYTYSWSNGTTTNPTGSTLSAGTYSVTITDNTGTSMIAGVTITQPPALEITIASATNVTCHSEGSISANSATGGTSPYTYSWSGGGGAGLTASNLSAGTYTITVTDNSGCTATVSVPVLQNAYSLGVTISSISNETCNTGGSATANLVSNSGLNMVTFSYETAIQNWRVPAGVITLTVSVTGAMGGGGTDPGLGASFSGICTVIPGDNISVVTGGIGGNTGVYNGNGGGGGTFVYDSNTTNLLAVAAGGGGQSYNVVSEGGDGGTDLTFNTTTASTSGTGNGSGGTGGNGGSAGTGGAATGAGGAGWLTNGQSSLSAGGNDRASGFAATPGVSGDLNGGGFGGGGAASSVGGGGGGGYNGGGGGDDGGSFGGAGGGGGSYLNGTLLGTATAINADNGSASISYNAPGGIPPYTYSWSGGGGTNLTATGLSAGTYTITITDNNGCSGTASATITQAAFGLGITISSVTNVSCTGQSNGSATAAAATGGTSPYTYSWSAGLGISLSQSGLSSGIYTITATDNNGCSTSAAATITQPNALSVTPTIITQVSCNGLSNGSGYAAVSGGTSPYTYSWSTGATTSSISGLSAGNYSVIVKDMPGCSVTNTLSILQPGVLVANASVPDNVSCHGEANGQAKVSPVGGQTPYTYSWSPISNSTYLSTGLSAGVYTVTVKDRNGCTGSSSVTVTQPAAAMRDSVNISNPTCYDGKGSATVGVKYGTSPYTYTWSPSVSTTATATGLTARSYVVTVKDKNGCSSSLTFSITQPLEIRDSIVKAATVNVLCGGTGDGSVTLGVKYGTLPYTFTWNPNVSSSSTANGLSAGTYTVTVKDGCGNSATASVAITQPKALRDSISSSSCSGGAAKATVGVKGGTSPYTYSWSPGGGTKATMTGLSIGTYSVTVTDKNGCSSSFTTIADCPPSVESPDNSGVPEDNCCQDGIENVNLYPNPNKGQFTIAGIEQGMIIEVYDYTGRKISTITATNETMQLNISNESSGLYLIRIIDKDGNLVSQKKVVKVQ